MKRVFDDGSFLKDFEKVVNDAKNNQPALIVVPTDREVETFHKRFAKEGTFIFCCSIVDYVNGRWTNFSPMPKWIFGFRRDDMWNMYSMGKKIVYVTERYFKKEESKS